MLARFLSLQTHHLVAIAVLSSLLTGGVVGLCLTDVLREPQFSTENHTRMTMLSGEALRLGEVLTLSCEVATLTGDPAWRERYEQYSGSQASTLQAIENLSMQIFGKPFGRKATGANSRMTSVELQSFDLADAGDKAAALAMLGSERYHNDKSSFATCIAALGAEVEQVVADQKRSHQTLGATLGLIVLVVVCALNWVLFRARSSAIRLSESRTIELAREQKRLSALIEHAPVAVAMLDDKLNFIATSRRWLDDYGLEPEATIGRNVQDVELSVPSRLDRAFQRCLAGVNNAQGDQAWCPTGSDEERHLMWELRPWKDADGLPGGTIVFTHDITEERNVQQNLRRRQATDAHMSRLAGVGWWELTVETGVVVWSDETRAIHGVGADFNPTLDNALAFYSEASRKVVSECVNCAIEKQTSFRFEEQLTTMAGKTIWLRCIGEPVVQDGKVVRMVGACQDVSSERAVADRLTASKHATEEFAAELAVQHKLIATQHRLIHEVVECIPDGVYWKDCNQRYVGCNGVYASFLGVSSPDELIGKTDADLRIAPSSGGGTLLTDQEIVECGTTLTDCEVLLQSDCGDSRVVLVSKAPLLDQAGDSTGVMGIYRDVTGFRELERDLAQARKLESIGQLSAGIAHEINTPMQCVGINLEFLQEHCAAVFALADDCLMRVADQDVLWDKAASGGLKSLEQYQLIKSEFPGALEDANDATSRIVEIISAMKAMSHNGDHVKVHSDVTDLIRNAATVSRHRWKAIADLEFKIDADLPDIEIMPAEISQVWLNLIVNSCDAIAERLDDDKKSAGESMDSVVPGRLVLQARVQDGGIAFACIDNGSGIARHARERIFDPFFTTKEVGHGTGQGLAITYDIIVNRHGGRIQVGDGPDGGTNMSFWIPLTASAAVEQSIQAAESEREATAPLLTLTAVEPDQSEMVLGHVTG